MLFATFAQKLLDFAPFVAVFALLAIVLAISLGKKKTLTTREIAISATCLAASFALSYIKTSPVANGGSITLASFVPVLIAAYALGIRKGLLIGLIYSVLQIIQEPYLVHPVQVLLDYILAFSAIGAVGALKAFSDRLKGTDILIMTFLIYVFRFFCHVVSGRLYFVSTWWASISYSLTYIPLDFAITLVVLIVLIASKTLPRLLNMINRDSATIHKTNSDTPQ